MSNEHWSSFNEKNCSWPELCGSCFHSLFSAWFIFSSCKVREYVKMNRMLTLGSWISHPYSTQYGHYWTFLTLCPGSRPLCNCVPLPRFVLTRITEKRRKEDLVSDFWTVTQMY